MDQGLKPRSPYHALKRRGLRGAKAQNVRMRTDEDTIRKGFQIGNMKIDLLQWSLRMRTRSKLGKACCVCNDPLHREMHHVRHIRKTGKRKPTGFNAILQALNRKQLPVCTSCHKKIHRGEYDGLRLADLAYNPYAAEKHR